MQALIAALVIYAMTFCVIFLVQLGMPRRYPDRDVAWFLAANATSDLTTLSVALLITLHLAHGGLAGYLFAAALAIQGAFYTYRARLGRMMARGKLPKARRTMRVKVSPEVIRIVLAVVAGLQLFASMLTGVDALPGKVLVVLTAACAAVALMCSTYTQGLQTNPPQGMLTEERAKELETASAPSAPPETPTAPLPRYEPGTATPPLYE